MAVAKGSPLDRLLAEAEIRRVLGRYCRAVDRMDEALLRSCYHPGAIDSHGNFEGDVDEFVPWCLGMVARYTVTMHFLGTILIDPTDDPDVVMSEAYAVALHRRDGGQPHHNLTAGFRYLDRFERRPVDGGDEAWRIGARVAVSEWLVKDPEAGWWPVADSFLQGRRDREDASYRVSRTPGTPPLPR